MTELVGRRGFIGRAMAAIAAMAAAPAAAKALSADSNLIPLEAPRGLGLDERVGYVDAVGWVPVTEETFGPRTAEHLTKQFCRTGYYVTCRGRSISEPVWRFSVTRLSDPYTPKYFAVSTLSHRWVSPGDQLKRRYRQAKYQAVKCMQAFEQEARS